MIGTITRINFDKGTGNITTDDGHRNAIRFYWDELIELPYSSALIGQRVEFVLSRDEHIRVALDVSPVDMPARSNHYDLEEVFKLSEM